MTLHMLKCGPLSQTWMTPLCPSIPFGCEAVPTLCAELASQPQFCYLAILSRWFLGLFFTVIISGLNQFFSFRCECAGRRPAPIISRQSAPPPHFIFPFADPAVTITALIAQLLSLPVGKLFELTLPTKVFRLFGYEVRAALAPTFLLRPRLSHIPQLPLVLI
jgi:hypothetical protein